MLFVCSHGPLTHVLPFIQSDEVIRKAAYDILLGVCSDLQSSSSSTPDGPYYKLINMVINSISSLIING